MGPQGHVIREMWVRFMDITILLYDLEGNLPVPLAGSNQVKVFNRIYSLHALK